ncbi:hypothetical protein GCM10023334_083460 [Nonomuraea thailandensis]
MVAQEVERLLAAGRLPRQHEPVHHRDHAGHGPAERRQVVHHQNAYELLVHKLIVAFDRRRVGGATITIPAGFPAPG